jgi:hypothetical protein
MEKPQCVACSSVLSRESLKPSKLKSHLTTMHPNLAEKPVEFFRMRAEDLTKRRMDGSGAHKQQSSKTLEASYIIAFQIAKQKRLTQLQRH